MARGWMKWLFKLKNTNYIKNNNYIFKAKVLYSSLENVFMMKISNRILQRNNFECLEEDRKLILLFQLSLKLNFTVYIYFPLYVKPQNILLAEPGPLLFLSGGPGLSGSCKAWGIKTGLVGSIAFWVFLVIYSGSILPWYLSSCQ